MSDYSCNIVNRSTGVGVSGARPHKQTVSKKPVHSKTLMFMLCIHLMECYMIKSIGSLALNILYVYIHSVINEVWNLL
jgi:hypothetical protein